MAAISPALQTHRSPQKCPLALLALSKTPPLLTQRKLRHRSTRTLNPLAPGAAAPSKPNFHQHAAHEPPSALSASSKMARISAWYRRAYLSPREVADHHTPGAVLPPDFFVLNDLFYVLFFFFFKIFPSPAIDFSFFMCYICINI